MRDWLDIATLASHKNLKGRFTARSAVGLPFLLEPGAVVHLVPPALDAPRCVTVNFVGPVRNDKAEVGFAEINNAETAEVLSGCHCLVHRKDVSRHLGSISAEAASDALAEYSGCILVDEKEGVVGEILRIEESPAQPLLVVAFGGREVLVPLAEELVVAKDASARELRMDLPQGILEI